MKIKTALIPIILTILISSNAFGIVWTETFDDGVGRLSHTNGNGDTWFAWDSGSQNIDATFYRGHTYERFALLGNTYLVGQSVLGFSVAITPLSGSSGYGAGIGFINSDNVDSDNPCTVIFDWEYNRLTIQNGVDEGQTSGYISANYGTTYFIDALMDGLSNLFSIDVYLGNNHDGTYLGNLSCSLGSRSVLELDALGFTNRLSYSGYQSPIRMDIDNLSYTIPEPVTLILIGCGGLFLRRK
jgi:hypothetical protein